MVAVVPPPTLCQCHTPSLTSVRTRVFLVAIFSSLATWQAVSGLSPVNMITCTDTKAALKQILGSIVVSISACHAEDPGSIPGRGALFSIVSFYYEITYI